MHHLEFYNERGTVRRSYLRSAEVLRCRDRTKEVRRRLPRRSRGTPRLANRLAKESPVILHRSNMTERSPMKVAVFALDLLEVDQYGLDKIDRRILQDSDREFSGRPGGTGNPGCGQSVKMRVLWRMFTSRIFCRMDFSTELRGGAQRPHLPINISESTGFHDFSVPAQ